MDETPSSSSLDAAALEHWLKTLKPLFLSFSGTFTFFLCVMPQFLYLFLGCGFVVWSEDPTARRKISPLLCSFVRALLDLATGDFIFIRVVLRFLILVLSLIPFLGLDS
jgi:hypothetical protein